MHWLVDCSGFLFMDMAVCMETSDCSSDCIAISEEFAKELFAYSNINPVRGGYL